jgi:hypothetical protein
MDARGESMDLTDDLRREEEMLHLTSLAEVFGSFAHEIAQPLNAIMIASQVLQLKVERSLLNEQEKSFLLQRLSIVTNQVQRASDTVDVLRNFTRRGEGRYADYHVVNIFRRILGLMDQQFVMRGIQVGVEEAEGKSLVTEDPATAEAVIVQGLAFSRDSISGLGSWHANQGIGYEKQVNIRFSEGDAGPVMEMTWNRGQLPEGTHLTDPPERTALAVAAGVLKARGGSLSVREDQLIATFPGRTVIR